MTRAENRWEELAREDAEFYIWTDLAPGDDFFRSGERDAQRILAFAGRHVASRSAALEIGCGVGRITIPMSREFGRIIAVDIAPTMLAKLAENCASRGITNVAPIIAGAAWEHGGPVAFAYSRIVFQHIESWKIIADYFARIARALAPDGVFYVQFDTRPGNVAYRFRNALPDALLPRTFRRGVRRIRRRTRDIIDLASRSGLEAVLVTGDGTFDTEFVFRPASA